MNLDRLQRFPNQIIEQRREECVGETIADLVGNIADQPMDPGFSYAAALKVANTLPTTAGSDPYSGMLSAVVYGALPTSKEAFDAATTSELYEANFANYVSALRTFASQFVQNGTVQLRSYKDIQNYLLTYKQGCQLGMRWYSSFNTPLPDGSLPPPSGPYSEHCVAVYEDTDKGLRIKPWLGADFGDHGYVYLPEALFTTIFGNAAGFDPNASRWWSLAFIGLTHWNLAADILPMLKTS